MSMPFLATKLYLPQPRPQTILRTHLIEQLNKGLSHKLILVSAPAGYGKTTLITTWLHQLENILICWLSLDEDDSDPQQFFHYLAAAVRPLPHIQTSLPQLLEAQQPLSPKTLMKAFVHDVVPVPTPFILVLDDYHSLDSAELEAAMTGLLDLMPPQMTLVLTSRSDPGFPIARLRARGELLELRADALRFTEDEAAAFFQHTMHLTLLPDQVTALEHRTEGWIAGLQMAALSMQNRAGGDLDGFVRNFTGSHRFIMDYLTDEVLAQIAPEVQTFLLQTAVLHRFSAALCNAVLPHTNGGHSQEMLERLEATNSFLLSLDDERRWYRYHHLFADLLRQKVPAATARTIRQNAAAWSLANGYFTDAIEYALAAAAWEYAVPLLVEHGLSFLFQGKLNALRRWLESFPDEILLQQPRMCLDYAWVLVNQGEKDAVEPYLLAADAAAQGAPATRSVTALIRANNGRACEDLALMQDEASLALQLIPPDHAVARCTGLLQLGVVQMMTGDPATAVTTLEETLTLARQSHNMNSGFLASGYLGLAHLLRDEVATALSVLQQAQTFAAAHSLEQSPLLAYVHLALAHLAFLDRSWDVARSEIEQAQAHSRFANEISSLYRSGLLLALIEQAAGNYDRIPTVAAEVEETAARLKNPEVPSQLQLLRKLVNQREPSPAQLETMRRVAAGSSLAAVQAVTLPTSSGQPLIDPLSDRELEILALITAGLKNKEIAEQLIISLNTVLYHTKNIYGKLGVNKRALAIAKAKELDLV